MGIFDRFPYSSTHEMNLDFMLGKATEIAEDMQTVATGMAQVQAGLSAISEKTEQATQAAAQAAQSASSIEGSVTAAEEAAEEAQMHNESAQTWANNAMTYKADCQRAATEAAASSSSAAQAATAAAGSEDTVAQYAQAANASAQSAANNNDSAHQYANQASASASNATFHSSNAQTAATNANTSATNAQTAATNAQTAATRTAALKDDCETLHRMCTAAVDQAATEAVNAANSAAQAAATKTDVENLVESLPEDFTDLNNTVNQLSGEIDDIGSDVTDLKSALSESEETVTSAGHNMINLDDLVTGYYYGSAIGRKISFANSGSYRAVIVPVEPNTDYYVNANARFWAFTDDNDIVVSYGENAIIGIINSGSGTKFYFSQNKSIFENWANYGFSYAVIMSKGNHGASTQVKKPKFISGINQNMMDAKYGCSLPKKNLYFTVGFEETWYTKNMIALEGNLVEYGIGGNGISVDGGTKITPVSGGGDNGYFWSVYDERLAQIAQQSQLSIYGVADNLSNCTALVIGDSTVGQNRMTQGMLDLFGAREKTLTLLGTRGTAPNLHEGRAGWSAYDYCSIANKGSTPNLFFNPTTNKFDFSYYMSNQGYTAVDFVVIQLGINDLYNRSFMNSDSIISATVDYVSEIIASIKAWNADQKILLNLPTALNDDQKKQYGSLKLIRNMFVRYNEAIQLKVIKDNKIRCSYCHLILDPTTDISDDVHPTAVGYQKMAAEVVSQINCWQQV